MASLDIRTYPDLILTQKAGPVEEANDVIRQLLDEMAKTMYTASGIGLAAPQVGISERVIVVDANPSVEAFTTGIILTVPDHYLEEHIWKHLLKEHLRQVFLWTFFSLLFINIGLE